MSDSIQNVLADLITLNKTMLELDCKSQATFGSGNSAIHHYSSETPTFSPSNLGLFLYLQALTILEDEFAQQGMPHQGFIASEAYKVLRSKVDFIPSDEVCISELRKASKKILVGNADSDLNALR